MAAWVAVPISAASPAPTTAAAPFMASNDPDAFDLTCSNAATAFSAVARISIFRTAALAIVGRQLREHVHDRGQVAGILAPQHGRGDPQTDRQHGDQPAPSVRGPVGSSVG